MADKEATAAKKIKDLITIFNEESNQSKKMASISPFSALNGQMGQRLCLVIMSCKGSVSISLFTSITKKKKKKNELKRTLVRNKYSMTSGEKKEKKR